VSPIPTLPVAVSAMIFVYFQSDEIGRFMVWGVSSASQYSTRGSSKTYAASAMRLAASTSIAEKKNIP
jgi:hypothetical protein